jgi:hypothetical protein
MRWLWIASEETGLSEIGTPRRCQQRGPGQHPYCIGNAALDAALLHTLKHGVHREPEQITV